MQRLAPAQKKSSKKQKSRKTTHLTDEELVVHRYPKFRCLDLTLPPLGDPQFTPYSFFNSPLPYEVIFLKKRYKDGLDHSIEINPSTSFNGSQDCGRDIGTFDAQGAL